MKRRRLNSRVRKTFRGHSRGFTLIEVVIAIALIGLIGAAVLSALSAASLALIIADQRATAESVARSEMEYVKNNDKNPYDATNSTPYYVWDSSIIPVNYAVDIAAVRLDPQNDGTDNDDGIQEITVTVTYQELRADNNMRERQYVLVDYKRNPEV